MFCEYDHKKNTLFIKSKLTFLLNKLPTREDVPMFKCNWSKWFAVTLLLGIFVVLVSVNVNKAYGG